MTIFNKLVKVQTEVGGILKDSKNPHLNNRFASLQAILSELVPALNSSCLFLTQNVDQGHDGTWAVETCVYDGVEKTSDKVSLGRVPVINSKGDAQGLGAAITYARRYGLAAAFGLWQTDNDNPASDAPAIPLNQPKKRFNSAGAVVQQEKPIENTAVTPDVTPVTAKPEVVTAKPEPVVSNEPAFDYQNNEHRALLTKAVKASGLTAQQLTPVRSFFTEGKWKEAAVPTNPDKLCAFLKEIAG